MNESPASVTILPPGVRLPDGRVLAFSPHRDCGCVDCVDAFAAWDAGDLRLPYEVIAA